MAEGAVSGRLDLMPLMPFDPLSDPTSLGQRWKAWKRRFEIYVDALRITEDKQKRAVLLYQVGQETQEIFDTIPDTGNDFTTAMSKLDNHFSPKTMKFSDFVPQLRNRANQLTNMPPDSANLHQIVSFQTYNVS